MVARNTEIYMNGEQSGTRLDFIHVRDLMNGESTQSYPRILSLSFDCTEHYVDPEQQLIIALESTETAEE